MKICQSCLKETTELFESIFDEENMICYDCICDENDSLYERDYACPNGCCICCGCSCR